MKITLIHGQNHKGSTYHIGKMLAEQFAGSDIQEFFLPRDLEHFCLGCYQCIEKEENCPFYHEKSRIMQAVESADLLTLRLHIGWFINRERVCFPKRQW